MNSDEIFWGMGFVTSNKRLSIGCDRG